MLQNLKHNSTHCIIPQDKINFNNASALNIIRMYKINHVLARSIVGMFDAY